MPHNERSENEEPERFGAIVYASVRWERPVSRRKKERKRVGRRGKASHISARARRIARDPREGRGGELGGARRVHAWAILGSVHALRGRPDESSLAVYGDEGSSRIPHAGVPRHPNASVRAASVYVRL